jgi:predicted Zn-dependent peptidase
VAQEHLPIAVDLLADMLRNSRLAPADLAREKSVVIEELGMLYDDPQDWVHVLADEALWPCQPMGREVAGTRESVRALRRRDLVAHLERYYGANNAVIGVAGGVELESCLRLVEERFGDWERVSPEEAVPAEVSRGEPRLRLEHRPTDQVNLCLVYPGLSRHHPDRWALDVLCTILGGGSSSRLFLQLRERLGLTYDIHAYPSSSSDTGSITIYAGVDAGRTDRALDAILREVDRLQRRRVSDAELRKAKEYFRGRLWLSLEDTFAVAAWFGSQEMLQHMIETPEDAAAATNAVSAHDVLRVARTYLQPQLLRIAAVGPVSELGLEARLASA